MWAVSFSLTVLLISHLRFSGLEAVSLNFLPSMQPRIVFGTVNTYSSVLSVLSGGEWSPVPHTSIGCSAWSYSLSLKSFCYLHGARTHTHSCLVAWWTSSLVSHLTFSLLLAKSHGMESRWILLQFASVKSGKNKTPPWPLARISLVITKPDTTTQGLLHIWNGFLLPCGGVHAFCKEGKF